MVAFFILPLKDGKEASILHNSCYVKTSYVSCQPPLKFHRAEILALQLRHLLWTTSKHDVYTTNENCINHFSTVARKSTKVPCPSTKLCPFQAHDNIVFHFKYVYHGHVKVQLSLDVPGLH